MVRHCDKSSDYNKLPKTVQQEEMTNNTIENFSIWKYLLVRY